MELARYKKLIFGGLFLVLFFIKTTFGLDVAGWFGASVDITDEGQFFSTGLDGVVNFILMALGLLGIYKPTNAPMPTE